MMIRQKIICLALLASSSMVAAFMPQGAGGQPQVRQTVPQASQESTKEAPGRLFPPPKMGFYGEQRQR